MAKKQVTALPIFLEFSYDKNENVELVKPRHL